MADCSRLCSRSKRKKTASHLVYSNPHPTMFSMPDGDENMGGSLPQYPFGYKPYTRDIFGKIIPCESLYSSKTGWKSGYQPQYMEIDDID